MSDNPEQQSFSISKIDGPTAIFLHMKIKITSQLIIYLKAGRNDLT